MSYTELVHSCNDDLKVAEWTECGGCHRWLAFRVGRDEEARPG
ncbi:hypothetical protein [Streptomyces eurocidicus]|uniref:Uncharacterized protein n=1 Tax=Streptomyces eurocidicus TaxID=66423 RepID=A0A7W8F2S2_STREU|nr:hypothetical protein [Streptomyces eurocidicus]MBB5121008.1 hypothetical protein [Streptomyces eurocidicus]